MQQGLKKKTAFKRIAGIALVALMVLALTPVAAVQSAHQAYAADAPAATTPVLSVYTQVGNAAPALAKSYTQAELQAMVDVTAPTGYLYNNAGKWYEFVTNNAVTLNTLLNATLGYSYAPGDKVELTDTNGTAKTSDDFSSTATYAQLMAHTNFYPATTETKTDTTGGTKVLPAIALTAAKLKVSGTAQMTASNWNGKDSLVKGLQFGWGVDTSEYSAKDPTSAGKPMVTGVDDITLKMASANDVRLMSFGLSSSKQVKVSGSMGNKAYTGKQIRPAIVVKNAGAALVEGTDYSVAYVNNTSIGLATVCIYGTGSYAGIARVTFSIVPKTTSIKMITVGNNKLKVYWNKVKGGVSKYQVRYAKKGSSKYKTVTVSAKSKAKTIAKLANKKAYKVAVRSYKTVDNVKYYSSWSKTKSSKKTK
jgi:hypothetical protein